MLNLINAVAGAFIWFLTGRTEETQYQRMQRLFSK